MNVRINEPISVIFEYNHRSVQAKPKQIEWAGKTHQITGIGYHYPQLKGNTLYHMFSVVSQSNYFKLAFNTENLQWHLEEVSPASG